MAEKERFDLSNGKKLIIDYGESPENPREWDNAATFVCGHRRNHYGDIQVQEGTCEELARIVLNKMLEDMKSVYLNDEMKERSAFEAAKLLKAINTENEGVIHKTLQKVAMLVPIYMYEHSGIALSTGGFADPFDSGLLGFAFITNAKLRAEWGGGHYDGGTWVHGSGILNKKRLERARKCIETEVDTYGKFLNGDVWGFRFIDENDVETDSCWGFYDDDYRIVLEHLAKADVRRLRHEFPYTFGRLKKK